MTSDNYDTGWIGLYRSLLKHWIYPSNRPFTKYEAWLDLLLTVNYENKKVFSGEDLTDCEKGEIITSQLKLMKRWKWSKSKLLKFISVLENDKMCTVKSDNKKTSLKICNYINYQDFKKISKNKKTTKKTVDDTTERLQKDTTKEDKEDNNIKKEEESDILKAWLRWKEYKKSEFRFSYKSEISENAAKKDLLNLSNNNEIVAIKIIEQSIASGWKGFFKLKENGNNQKNNGASNEELSEFIAKKFGSNAGR